MLAGGAETLRDETEAAASDKGQQRQTCRLFCVDFRGDLLFRTTEFAPSRAVCSICGVQVVECLMLIS